MPHYQYTYQTQSDYSYSQWGEYVFHQEPTGFKPTKPELVRGVFRFSVNTEVYHLSNDYTVVTLYGYPNIILSVIGGAFNGNVLFGENYR